MKNALKDVREQLRSLEWGDGEIEVLTAKAAAFLEDNDFWQNQGPGLALFIDRSSTTELKLPAVPPELCILAERFHVRPLIGMFRDRGWGHVLSATRDGVSLFRCSNLELKAVDVMGLPDGIEALRGQTDFDADLGYHVRDRGSQIGGADQPQYHALGESPDDYDDVLLEKYATEIGKAVEAHLTGDDSPLVLAAMPRLAGRLKLKLDRCSLGLADTTIYSDPASLSDGELRRQAWEIAEPLLSGTRADAIERLSAWSNGAQQPASCNLEGIFRATEEGRVEVLFLPRDKTVWGNYDSAHRIVRIDPTSQPHNEDLLNQAALQTIAQGGEVFSIPDDIRSDMGPAVALFRY